MEPTYNTWLVALSIVVAMVVAYTALKLADAVAGAASAGAACGCRRRGRDGHRHLVDALHRHARLLRADIRCATTSRRPSRPSAIAIVISGFALAIASRPQLSLQRLDFGARRHGCRHQRHALLGHGRDPDQPVISVRRPARALPPSPSPWLRRSQRCGSRSACAAASHGRSARARRAASSWVSPSAACTTPPWRRASLAAARSASAGGFDNGWLAVTIGITAFGGAGDHADPAVYDAHLQSQTSLDALRLAQVNAASPARQEPARRWRRAPPESLRGSSTSPRARTVWMENEIESLKTRGRRHAAESRQAIRAMMHPDDARSSRYVRKPRPRRATSRARAASRVVTPAGNIVICRCTRASSATRGKPQRTPRRVVGRERRGPPGASGESCSCSCAIPRARPAWPRSPPVYCTTSATCSTASACRHRSCSRGFARRVGQRAAHRRALVAEDHADLRRFLATTSAAARSPAYLAQLGENLATENAAMQTEVGAISRERRPHPQIVAAQQSYARRGGLPSPWISRSCWTAPSRSASPRSPA